MADIGLLPNTVPYTSAPAGGFNPLDRMQQVQNLVFQNKLFPGEYQQQQQAIQQGGLNIQKSQLDLAMVHNQNMMSRFSALAAKPNLSVGDLQDSASDMVAQGLVTPQQAAQELARVSALPQQDSGTLRNFITQSYLLPQMNAQQQMEAMYGAPMVTNTGGQTQVGTFSPINGYRAAGSFQNTLSPEGAASRVPTFQNGQPGSVPQSSLVTPTGQAPQGAAPASVGPLGTGRLNAPPAAPQGPAGFVPSGPKLGAESAANVTGTQSAQQGVDLQKMADTVPQQKAILGNLDADLNSFTAGPAADWTKVAKAWVNRNNPIGNLFDPSSISSQDEFNKQAFQLAQAQFQSLGGTGTDAKLDSTMHSSPNEALSDQSNREIIALLKGNADAIGVKNREWQQWLQSGHGPESYGQFSTAFNQTYDPRVFQAQYMDNADKQKMVKGMSPAEQKQFRQSYNVAVDDGWIPDPRGGAPANAAVQ